MKYVRKISQERHKGLNKDILKPKTLDNDYLKESINDILSEFKVKFRMVSLVQSDWNKDTEMSTIDLYQHIGHFRSIDGNKKFTRTFNIPFLNDTNALTFNAKYRLVNVVSPTVINLETNKVIIKMIKKTFSILNRKHVVLVNGRDYISWISYSPDLHKPSDRGSMKIPFILYALVDKGLDYVLPGCKIEKIGNGNLNNPNCTIVSSDETSQLCLVLEREASHNEINIMANIMYMFDCLPSETVDLYDSSENWVDIMCMLSSNGKHINYNKNDITFHLNILDYLNEAKTFSLIEDAKIRRFSDLVKYISINILDFMINGTAKTRHSIGYRDFIYENILGDIVSACGLMKDGDTISKQIDIFINKTNRLASSKLNNTNPSLIPYQQVNAFGVYGDLKQNVRNTMSLEAKIPNGKDMCVYNMVIIPVTNPMPYTINPYVRTTKDGFIKECPDGIKINKELI